MSEHSNAANPALVALDRATTRLGIDFAALVAEVGIWASPEAHARNVTPSSPTGAVRPDVRRARPGSGEKPGAVVDGIRLDRNNYAGQAIRAAVGLGAELAGYQACHVWPGTCYDARYHTVLANLVLIPAPIVSLTDHAPEVVAALKFRSFELYGWKPVEAEAPTRPPNHPTSWREPVRIRSAAPPPTSPGAPREATQRAVMRRLWSRHDGDEAAVVAEWVAMVQSGGVERRSNERGQTDREYARRLIYDGKKRGWIE
jgi:hypothetical protein